MSIIQVDHLTKQYGNGEAAVLAVRDIHFDIASGEWIAIMGESGSTFMPSARKKGPTFAGTTWASSSRVST
jgi:ABC-type microcin C transport system duplicated ATPase subunit YejF